MGSKQYTRVVFPSEFKLLAHIKEMVLTLQTTSISVMVLGESCVYRIGPYASGGKLECIIMSISTDFSDIVHSFL